MNTTKLSPWLTIIANLGLVAGMVLVAYEINQNSQLARTALVNEGNIASNEFWANLMGDTPSDVIAMAVECPEAMTYSDFMVMDAFLYSGMNFLYRNYQLAQEGIFTDEDWKEEVERYSAWYLGNPFGRAWWEAEGEIFNEKEFLDYVDLQLEGTVKDSYAYYLEVRKQLFGPGNANNAVVNSSCPPQ